MTDEQKKNLMGLALAGAALYAVWRFAPNQAVKVMALGAGGVIVGKQLPYVKNALA